MDDEYDVLFLCITQMLLYVPIYYTGMLVWCSYLHHPIDYSQSEIRQAVVYSVVLDPTFPSRLARISLIVLATVFSMAWYKIVIDGFHMTSLKFKLQNY